MTRLKAIGLLLWMLIAAFAAAPAMAQVPAAPGQPAAAPAQGNPVKFWASLGADPKPVESGLVWRVFQERIEGDGERALVAQSDSAAPVLTLPNGDYVVHVSYGLASAIKRLTVLGQTADQRLTLNAGALRFSGLLGDAPIPPARLRIDVFVPERAGQQARLVAADVRAETAIRLPEGAYQVISTYLESNTTGSSPAPGAKPSDTNSVVNGEVRVTAGKLTEVTLRHHAATLTLKLVNQPGGEALANTSFSVLTPGGDVIRELIGAFPQVLLAEGEYAVIARRDGKTYQGTFNVQSTLDRDVEVVAK